MSLAYPSPSPLMLGERQRATTQRLRQKGPLRSLPDIRITQSQPVGRMVRHIPEHTKRPLAKLNYKTVKPPGILGRCWLRLAIQATRAPNDPNGRCGRERSPWINSKGAVATDAGQLDLRTQPSQGRGSLRLASKIRLACYGQVACEV